MTHVRKCPGVLPTLVALATLLGARPAQAYIEAPHTLGRVTQESTNVLVVRVEKVERGRNLIVFRKVRDLKGTHNGEVLKHNIGNAGFSPRESQTIMAWAEPGKVAVIFHNGSASETCIPNYWYQNSNGGEWWTLNHGEPYLLRGYCGDPQKLVAAVTTILAGQEVVVPCMLDGNKDALQQGTAKIQRLKASLKIQDYNPKRDFVGWGDESYRRVAGMPGFSQIAALKRVDPDALGVAPVDFDGDGKPDLCLFGASKLGLFQNGDAAPSEVSLPYPGGARGAAWADFDGDGKSDLLLATPQGPKLLANRGATFADESQRLPEAAYSCPTAATWVDYDGDKHPDILLAEGSLGLRLYRNTLGGAGAGEDGPPVLGPWHVIGPFPNDGGQGFAKAFPPESEIKLDAQYDGARGEKAAWRVADFPDGPVHSLAIFQPRNNNNSAVYLFREIKTGVAVELPVGLGSDDTLTVWLNGVKIVEENGNRAAAPDTTKATLKLRPGKNALLLKVCQGGGEWGFCFHAGTAARAFPQTFADVSAAVGLGPDGLGGALKTDHLAIADVDGDGRPDFLASAGEGLLALNTPKGFVEAKGSGLRFHAGKVAPAFGDFDGDGAPDLFVPQTGGSKLFRNEGGGKFVDATARAGDLAKLAGQATCAAWADSGRAGRPDLYVGCLRAPNRFFRNQGDGSFVDATEEIGLSQRIFNTRGLASMDLNKDGAPDLILVNEGQDSAVLLGNPARAGKPEVADARPENRARGTIRP